MGSELLRQIRAGSSALGALPEDVREADIAAVDIGEMDIGDMEGTLRFVSAAAPDAIINCAAYTNVDACESDPDAAFRANAAGARNVAIAAREMGAKLIHVSTDYVFSGDGSQPYCEWDECRPQTAYGRSKLLGEEFVRTLCPNHLIARTSWLYGRWGGNFVKTILRAAKERGAVRVVDDQRGNPTNAEDLAHHLLLLAATRECGVYHITGNGVCSWYEFAREFVRLSGLSCSVDPCTTQEFPRPAPRPAYSALEHRMLRATVGDGMRDWKEAIASFMTHFDPEKGEIV